MRNSKFPGAFFYCEGFPCAPCCCLVPKNPKRTPQKYMLALFFQYEPLKIWIIKKKKVLKLIKSKRKSKDDQQFLRLIPKNQDCESTARKEIYVDLIIRMFSDLSVQRTQNGVDSTFYPISVYLFESTFRFFLDFISRCNWSINKIVTKFYLFKASISSHHFNYKKRRLQKKIQSPSCDLGKFFMNTSSWISSLSFLEWALMNA